MKVGNLTVKAMPGQEMTEEEIARQLEFVSRAAVICEEVSEADEVEMACFPLE